MNPSFTRHLLAPLAALFCLVPGNAQVVPFPAAGSEAARVDAAIVLWTQRTRTAASVAKAKSEVILGPAAYSEALGQPLDARTRPLTCALFEEVARELKAITDPLKKQFARPRPYDADPQVKPAIDREPSFSYPSGHATRGLAFALILAELVPAQRDAILEAGFQVGVDRVIGGVHYPTDIEAGQRLGGEWARVWLSRPVNQARLGELRAAEWSR
jgi:membrane-associated phospholipid phosphatase